MKKAISDMQQFSLDQPSDYTHTGLWPNVTPVNTELALGWKVLIVLATFPWWYGMAHLIMVGW